jgi:hypothetical protein
MQVPLGACPRCGGLLMLQQQPSQGGGGGAGVAAAAAAPRIVCQADLPCSFRLSLPRCVASAGVSQRQCGRCRHGQVMQLELQLRMAIVPPGARSTGAGQRLVSVCALPGSAVAR